ncbi:MAG: PrgI family protein [Lachnospiraceae bacterium]|nr:PrgI family protein [Lachnospiraceae bacterium]
MISVRIEKEIKGENKVALGLNFRQLICVSVCGGLAVGLSLVTGLPITEAVLPDTVLAVVAYYVGWKEVNGMKAEYFALKRVKELVYRNQVRTYRTKNRYVTLLNERYQAMRTADMLDKEKAKLLKKEEKWRRKSRGSRGRSNRGIL